MRKIWWILVLGLLLTGCGAAETYETVADEVVASVLAEPKEVRFELPEESILPAMETDNGKLYMCSGYDVSVQTMEGGDLDGTIRQVSGYGREDLTVIETADGGLSRYELVWTSAGDGGQKMGRAVILDDGKYHYVLSAMADAEKSGEYQEMWNGMFDSFALVTA